MTVHSASQMQAVTLLAGERRKPCHAYERVRSVREKASMARTPWSEKQGCTFYGARVPTALGSLS
jgi:hypothetical protein